MLLFLSLLKAEEPISIINENVALPKIIVKDISN